MVGTNSNAMSAIWHAPPADYRVLQAGSWSYAWMHAPWSEWIMKKKKRRKKSSTGYGERWSLLCSWRCLALSNPRMSRENRKTHHCCFAMHSNVTVGVPYEVTTQCRRGNPTAAHESYKINRNVLLLWWCTRNKLVKWNGTFPAAAKSSGFSIRFGCLCLSKSLKRSLFDLDRLFHCEQIEFRQFHCIHLSFILSTFATSSAFRPRLHERLARKLILLVFAFTLPE